MSGRGGLVVEGRNEDGFVGGGGEVLLGNVGGSSWLGGGAHGERERESDGGLGWEEERVERERR